MEAVEEPPLLNCVADAAKVIVVDETSVCDIASVEANVCHKSNGVSDSTNAEQVEEPVKNVLVKSDEDSVKEDEVIVQVRNEETSENMQSVPMEVDVPVVIVTAEVEEITCDISDTTKETKDPEIVEVQEPEKSAEVIEHPEITVEVDGIVEESSENITFETEILVEANDSDHVDTTTDSVPAEEYETTNNILSELNQSIRLSEVLRSSDNTENVENNNCDVRQEMFNKEELLHILEGNDVEQSRSSVSDKFNRESRMLEQQLALQQLSKLKSTRHLNRHIEKQFGRRKKEKPIVLKVSEKESIMKEKPIVQQVPEKESIVNVLVKDWDEDDTVEEEQSNKLSEKGKSRKSTEHDEKPQEDVVKQEESLIRSSIDSSKSDGPVPNSNKGSEEIQPQRRLGRVIKKKVIFDPDNPDTFTKGKTFKLKDEKEHPPSKKIKSDHTIQMLKSKSPLSKLQWKKPSSKTMKPNRNRLTEIDKLLMDEGAVNMICQLTPEAPKGKKNMKSKAEFIKKIQSSSTPNTKEMKFRERKKESKSEENEAKKILISKQRLSGGSVKSPSACEDFEAHSADDSIIYRRHSSSSYSSSCMSPRRLSDVEASLNQSSVRATQLQDISSKANDTVPKNNTSSADVFMSDAKSTPSNKIIDKNDCFSLREKLNSKLSLALNKRKRDSIKLEKTSKTRKLSKSEDQTTSNVEKIYKHVMVTMDQALAEINIMQSSSMFSLEMIEELNDALAYIESRKDISVTLLVSECGSLCSGLELRPLLDDNHEKRTKYANELAEAIRSLLQSVHSHSKLVCSGAGARCAGAGVALLALSDVALAGERASFALAAPLQPGSAALTAYNRSYQQSLINELIVFGRCISASEALQGGLISRVLWPERFLEQVRAIAKDLAAQPLHNIALKKQLIGLKKSASDSTFVSCLEKERDLFVQYWTSDEGQELLRSTLNAAQ